MTLDELAKIAPKVETIPVVIVHPATEESIGVTVQVRSVDDPRVKKVTRKWLDRKTYLEQRAKNLKAADFEEMRIENLVAAVDSIDWGPVTAAPLSAELFKEIVEKTPWFAEQIEEVATDTKVFFTGSK